MCHYQGKIKGIENSWAAITTCGNKISGVIYDGNEMHYIEKGSSKYNTSIDDEHYLYKHSDLNKHNKTCGYVGDSDHDHRDVDDILDFEDFTKPNRISRVSMHLEGYIFVIRI